MDQDLFKQHDFIKQIVDKVMSKIKQNEVTAIHPQPFPQEFQTDMCTYPGKILMFYLDPDMSLT